MKFEKKKIFPILKNKYFIVSIAFLVFIIFFDNDSFIERHKSMKKLKELEKQKEFYRSEIGKNKIRLIELQTDKDNLEKFAREEYLMKKPNEDIFVIIEE